MRHLTEKCESGTFVDIVQKSQGALSKAWREVNKDKNYEVNGLFRCAEGVVNKLTVFNVNINCLSIQPDQQDQILKIPKIHLETLQIFVSRYSRTKPLLERSKTLSKGLIHRGKTFGLEKGIKASSAVLLILEELAAFFSSNKIETELDKNDPENAKKKLAELINTKIEYRKNHPVFEHKESYYFLLEDGSALNDKDVRDELMRLIQGLDWITLRAGDIEQVFIIDDTKIMVALQEFYSTLDTLETEWKNNYKK